jgi:predicted transposase YdaD
MMNQSRAEIKASEQIGVSYMTMEERDRQIREDGYLTGEENGRKEGRAQGRIEGRTQGEARFARLTELLLAENKQEELLQAVSDTVYREQLYLEYQI